MRLVDTRKERERERGERERREREREEREESGDWNGAILLSARPLPDASVSRSGLPEGGREGFKDEWNWMRVRQDSRLH